MQPVCDGVIGKLSKLNLVPAVFLSGLKKK